VDTFWFRLFLHTYSSYNKKIVNIIEYIKYIVWKETCQIIFIPSQVTPLMDDGRRNKKRHKVYVCRKEIKWKLVIRTLLSLLSGFWHLHREGAKATCSYQNKEGGKEVVFEQWGRPLLGCLLGKGDRWGVEGMIALMRRTLCLCTHQFQQCRLWPLPDSPLWCPVIVWEAMDRTWNTENSIQTWRKIIFTGRVFKHWYEPLGEVVVFPPCSSWLCFEQGDLD